MKTIIYTLQLLKILFVINEYLVAANKEYYQYTQNTDNCGNVILYIYSVKKGCSIRQCREKGKEGQPEHQNTEIVFGSVFVFG